MPYHLRALQASNIEVKKEPRGVMATQTAATASAKIFIAENQNEQSEGKSVTGDPIPAGPGHLHSSVQGAQCKTHILQSI